MIRLLFPAAVTVKQAATMKPPPVPGWNDLSLAAISDMIDEMEQVLLQAQESHNANCVTLHLLEDAGTPDWNEADRRHGETYQRLNEWEEYAEGLKECKPFDELSFSDDLDSEEVY